MESSVLEEKSNERPVSSSGHSVDDLEREVNKLATKYIEIADSKTDLEEQVQVLRKELDVSRRNNMMLEDQISQQYVNKEEYLREVQLRKEAQDEAEKIHNEIDELTAKLFDEANKLVATANKEKAHLQAQLEERDVLLDNYKSQVGELKDIIQKQKDEEELGEVHSNRLSLISTPPPGGYQMVDYEEGGTPNVYGGGYGGGSFPFESGVNGVEGRGVGGENSAEAGTPATGTATGTTSAISVITSGPMINSSSSHPPSALPDDEILQDYSSDSINWPINDKNNLNSQIRPVIRKDTLVFEDFKSFIHNTQTNLLSNSINYSSLSAGAYFHTPGGFPGSFPMTPRTTSSPNLGNNGGGSNNSSSTGVNITSTSTTTTTATTTATTSTTTTSTTISSSSPRPNTPDSPKPSTTVSTTTYHTSTAALNSFKLYKRCLTEDIEPTLRLDLAPGISWLGRKGVMNSIVDGSAVVEPISGYNEGLIRSHNPSLYSSTAPAISTAPCALCGETRQEPLIYSRMHNLKVGKGNNSNTISSSYTTAEKKNGMVSSGYPLCHYCLNRVRTVCDFTSFLRSVRDRVWKVDEEEGLNKAWDEFARLRERMLWARIGGRFPSPMIFGPSLRSGRTYTPPIREDKEEKGEEEKVGDKVGDNVGDKVGEEQKVEGELQNIEDDTKSTADAADAADVQPNVTDYSEENSDFQETPLEQDQASFNTAEENLN